RLQPGPRAPLRRDEPVPSVHALRALEEAGRGYPERSVRGGGNAEPEPRGVLVLRPGPAAAPDALLHDDQGGQGPDRRRRRVAAGDVVPRQTLPGDSPRRGERGGAAP